MIKLLMLANLLVGRQMRHEIINLDVSEDQMTVTTMRFQFAVVNAGSLGLSVANVADTDTVWTGEIMDVAKWIADCNDR